MRSATQQETTGHTKEPQGADGAAGSAGCSKRPTVAGTSHATPRGAAGSPMELQGKPWQATTAAGRCSK
eukprot:8166161-Alexandrium_andersonii.AAC.1